MINKTQKEILEQEVRNETQREKSSPENGYDQTAELRKEILHRRYGDK